MERKNLIGELKSQEQFNKKNDITNEINQSALEKFNTQRVAIENLYFVESSDPDLLAQGTTTFNDPLRSQQTYLNSYSQNGGIGSIETYYSALQNGSEVKVAIMDSGYNTSHEDILASRIISPKYYTGTSINDTTGHGSLSMGIIGATNNNSKGIVGLCDMCKLMPIKVLNNSNTASYSDITSGVYWAIDHGAEVINMSLGAVIGSSSLQLALNEAHAKNIVVVAAAGNGNDSRPFFPAAYRSTISVGGSDNKGKASFSNYGWWLDISAPAVDIKGLAHGASNSYQIDSGTSFAAPQVTAAAALAVSKLKSQGKLYTVEDIRDEIIKKSYNNFSPNITILGVGILTLSKLNTQITNYNPDTTVTVMAYGINRLGATKPLIATYINGSKVGQSKQVPLNQWTNIVWYDLPPIHNNDELAIVYENDQSNANNDIDLHLWSAASNDYVNNTHRSYQIWGAASNIIYDNGTFENSVDDLSVQPNQEVLSNGYVYKWRDAGYLIRNGGVRMTASGYQPVAWWTY